MLLQNRISFVDQSVVMAPGTTANQLLAATTMAQFEVAATVGAQNYLATSHINDSGNLPPANGFDTGVLVLYDLVYVIGVTNREYIYINMYVNITSDNVLTQITRCMAE
jgi:hypothetical protein